MLLQLEAERWLELTRFSLVLLLLAAGEAEMSDRKRQTFSTFDLWLQNLLSRDFKAYFYAWNNTQRTDKETDERLVVSQKSYIHLLLVSELFNSPAVVWVGETSRTKWQIYCTCREQGAQQGGRSFKNKWTERKRGQRRCDGIRYTTSSRKWAI